MFSTDQSFPLAGGFAYSVYKFQQKRVKRDPEGPFLAGNPIVGAILSTVFNFALVCGVSNRVLPVCMHACGSTWNALAIGLATVRA